MSCAIIYVNPILSHLKSDICSTNSTKGGTRAFYLQKRECRSESAGSQWASVPLGSAVGDGRVHVARFALRRINAILRLSRSSLYPVSDISA